MPINIIIKRAKDYISETIIAFYDIELDFGQGVRITLYGLKLIRSKKDKSLFLGLPQRENDGKWYNYFYPSEELHTQLFNLCVEHYNSHFTETETRSDVAPVAPAKAKKTK